MYAKRLDIYGFKAFGKTKLSLQFPGRTGPDLPRLRNVNLILGDNGGGKSSVLRALAIAILAPALMESGFVAYRLVRRGRAEEQEYKTAFLKIFGKAGPNEYQLRQEGTRVSTAIELIARIERRDGRSLDRIHLEDTPASPIADRLFDDSSPAFFVVGYGATRRVETGDFSPSSARRSRGLRYQRVAGLFEDHLALIPLQSWMPEMQRATPHRFDEALDLLNSVLPENIVFRGDQDPEDGQYVFLFDGIKTPFSALSDGYRAFIGWVGDLTVPKAGFGYYVPALGGGEEALVNILPLYLPTEMYVASTPYDGKRATAVLLEDDEPARFDWTIVGGTFWSFRDPRTSCCRKIVEGLDVLRGSAGASLASRADGN